MIFATDLLLPAAEQALSIASLTRSELEDAIECSDEMARRLISILFAQGRLEAVPRRTGGVGAPRIAYRLKARAKPAPMGVAK